MKRILLVLSFLFVACIAQAETFNLRAFSINFAFENDAKDGFSPWTEPESTNVLLVIDKNTVNVYSEESQRFSVISTSEVTDVEDGSYFIIKCVDKNNTRCNILIYYKSGPNVYQVVITYSNIKICYNCKVE